MIKGWLPVDNPGSSALSLGRGWRSLRNRLNTSIRTQRVASCGTRRRAQRAIPPLRRVVYSKKRC